MKLRNISIVISREYLSRVKKKSFLIITFVAPLLFAALCLLPSLIMLGTKEDSKKIAVVDYSGVVAEQMYNTDVVVFENRTDVPVDSLKANLSSMGYDGYLVVAPLDSTNTVIATITTLKPLGTETSAFIRGQINDAVENYRTENSGIENLKQIMDGIKGNVNLISLTMDESGEEKFSESSVYMIVSMVLGMIIYMFIAIFGGMVMSSVIEEKASRVVEVLVSSVRATELMFGKIIGVALVAMTQFLLWIVITGGILFAVVKIGGPEFIGGIVGDAQQTQITAPGMGSEEMMDTMAQATNSPEGIAAVVGTLANMDIAQMLVCFVIFFIFGYMLYASLFAAIGSAVENEGDTQQLQIPITIPLILGFLIAISAMRAPDSDVVFWGSMIPFTSPIVMLARLPYGVPFVQLAISIALLVGTVALMAWISAKVYKVGILMFGKKPTWKDLWKWFKMK